MSQFARLVFAALALALALVAPHLGAGQVVSFFRVVTSINVTTLYQYDANNCATKPSGVVSSPLNICDPLPTPALCGPQSNMKCYSVLLTVGDHYGPKISVQFFLDAYCGNPIPPMKFETLNECDNTGGPAPPTPAPAPGPAPTGSYFASCGNAAVTYFNFNAAGCGGDSQISNSSVLLGRCNKYGPFSCGPTQNLTCNSFSASCESGNRVVYKNYRDSRCKSGPTDLPIYPAAQCVQTYDGVANGHPARSGW